MIDLRSDTVTKPTPAMRRTMANAEVGDDVYREDSTVRELEARIAEIAGKEAALFVPSGTMSNQIALLCHTRRGDEVVIGEGAHCAFYESGAAPAWSGVQFMTAGTGGLFTASELEAAIKSLEYYLPRTSVVAIENTHNRAGGRVFPQADIIAIASVARSHRLALHLDGARLWNAEVATGLSIAKLAEPFDTVSLCFSKGLGAPVGSALVGSRQVIGEALRFRKMLGGGMRQAGILAAGALHALTHHRSRLGEDHAHARVIAERLNGIAGAEVSPVETNIINVDTPNAPAQSVVRAAHDRGVLISASGARRVRIVTHLDVRAEDVPIAAAALESSIHEALRRERA
jgi:threonine aldolase